MVPSKIIVVKLCCIGDAVFVTPLLRALRKKYPEAHITYLASSWIKDIVAQIPFVDDMLVCNTSFLDGSLIEKMREATRVVWALRRGDFDMMVIGHRNRVFALLGWVAGVRQRFGFASRINFFLSRATPFDPHRHEILRYLDLIGTQQTDPVDMLTEVVPSDQQKANVEVMLRELRHDKLDGIGVLAGGGDNPGTSMHIKRWDLQNYADLSKRLLDEFPVSLFLLGGVSERELNDDLIELIGVSPGRLTNLAGRVPLAMLPAFLQRMKCVIGGDSGPLHLAAAVGTPTVILFGPSDPRLVAPLQKNSVHVWKRVHCSPCYTPETVLQKKYLVGNKFVCWTGTRECLNSLTVEEVYDVMRKMLRPAVVDSV